MNAKQIYKTMSSNLRAGRCSYGYQSASGIQAQTIEDHRYLNKIFEAVISKVMDNSHLAGWDSISRKAFRQSSLNSHSIIYGKRTLDVRVTRHMEVVREAGAWWLYRA